MTLLQRIKNTCGLASYPTPYLAHQAAKNHFAKPGYMYIPYICSECERWHIKAISREEATI